jgi:hypothetical protein
MNGGAAGGGAGGYQASANTVAALPVTVGQSYPVIVGAGGAGGTGSPVVGVDGLIRNLLLLFLVGVVVVEITTLVD